MTKAGKRFCLLAGVAALTAASAAGGSFLRPPAVDGPAVAAQIVSSLAERCPNTTPGDIPAFNSCRNSLGQGPEGASMNSGSLLWGGEQPGVPMPSKNLTWFRGDTFQRLYLSLFMFTGNWTGQTTEDGTYAIKAEAYFRNELPPGSYPYPFWHSAHKWDAYERANEIILYLSRDGRIRLVTRSDGGSYAARAAYRSVTPPAFTGQWTWNDENGAPQPSVTLFSDLYSAGNPVLPELDRSYRALAINMRDADCTSCHTPEGHKYMRRLSLLHTPAHAAGDIDAALRTVRDGTMPRNRAGDVLRLDPVLRETLLRNGEEFKRLLGEADAWERTNNPGRNAGGAAIKNTAFTH